MPRARKLTAQPPVPLDSLDGLIHTIRGERVILDADLARLYGVETKVLNQAIKRNREKFPPDFLLQLTRDEVLALNRSQIVTGSTQRHRDPRSRPFAFTEHGALMAANLLNSPAATQMSVFVRLAAQRAPAPLTPPLRCGATPVGVTISALSRSVSSAPSSACAACSPTRASSPRNCSFRRPEGTRVTSPFASLRGHALRRDHLRAAALRSRPRSRTHRAPRQPRRRDRRVHGPPHAAPRPAARTATAARQGARLSYSLAASEVLAAPVADRHAQSRASGHDFRHRAMTSDLANVVDPPAPHRHA